jgi:predicted MFS family arabinose efflux permease
VNTNPQPADTPASVNVRALPATVVLGLGMLITHGFGLALVPAMLPRIADDLDVGYGLLGAGVAAGLAAYALGAAGTSRFLDRIPNRAGLLGSYVVSGAGLLIAGMAVTPAMLIAAIVVLGFVAPVSWSLTLHVAGTTTARKSRAAVMASASGGAALGVLINGVLVQTSDSVHTWRVSFAIAAAIAVAPIVAGALVYRSPIPHPSGGNDASPATFRGVLTTPAGRVVVVSGLLAGVTGFPFNTFLTATAIDEMGVSALSAAALWWLIGIIGIGAGPVLGRYGDRTSPLQAVLAGAVLHTGGLVLLFVVWNYAGLVVAAIGYPLMNYPIWGLVGAVANREFDPGVAVRAISLGLVVAALGGAAGNAVVGPWLDATASFRGPVLAMALIAAAVTGWYMTIARSGGLEARSLSDQPSP